MKRETETITLNKKVKQYLEILCKRKALKNMSGTIIYLINNQKRANGV
jgi:hypothetical protein